jgi:hypothetical protein
MATRQELVQTGPDTWEVRTISRTPQPKKHPGPPTRKTPGLYLAPDESAVLNERCQVITTDLLILKRPVVNGYVKIFLRYLHEGVVYSGYTVHDPVGLIKPKATQLRFLDERVKSCKLRTCVLCQERFLRSFNSSVCPACTEKQQLARQAAQLARCPICVTEGCERRVGKDNKTGLCRRCYKQQGDFYAISSEFNPFYGKLLARNPRP